MEMVILGESNNRLLTDCDCYLPPPPNISLLGDGEVQVNSPSSLPSGWKVDLVFRNITTNGSEIIIKENVSDNESFLLSSLDVTLNNTDDYGLKWRPVKVN